MSAITIKQHGKEHTFYVIKKPNGYTDEETIAMLLDAMHPQYRSFDDLNKTVETLPHELYKVSSIVVRETIVTELDDGNTLVQYQFYYSPPPNLDLMNPKLFEGSSIMGFIGILGIGIELKPTGNYLKQLREYYQPHNRVIRFLKRIRIKFLFAWYDFWVGLFVDTKKKRLYIFPVPMLGIVIELKESWRDNVWC